MKGLLLKDFYTLSKQMKIFLVMLVIFACMPGMSMAPFAIIYSAMLPITALAYDERSKWDDLALMMPYSVKSLVISKYLLGYIAVVAATAISLAAQFVIALVQKATVASENIYIIFVMALIGTVLQALNLPLMFRIGVEKARILFFLIVAAVVAVGTIFADKIGPMLSEINADIFVVYGLIALAALVINIISICLSIVLYKKKRV